MFNFINSRSSFLNKKEAIMTEEKFQELVAGASLTAHETAVLRKSLGMSYNSDDIPSCLDVEVYEQKTLMDIWATKIPDKKTSQEAS